MSVSAQTLDREHDTCPKLIRANAQRWPDKETEHVVNHTEARFAVVEDQEKVDTLLGVKARCPRLEYVVYDDPRGAADDVSIIYYTSGTTGMPKGAMLSHRNLIVTPTYFFAPSRIWESILTNVMVRVEDAARPKRAMVHFFLRLAGDARTISENEDIKGFYLVEHYHRRKRWLS